MLSDFNCKIFNTDRLSLLDPDCDLTIHTAQINSDLSILDSFGIHRLFCQVSHIEDIPLNKTLSKITALESSIKLSVNPSMRRRFVINVVPSIHLSENAPFIRNISSLTVENSNYIFIDLPISLIYPDFIDGAINKILYNCKLRPIFNNFQDFASVYRDTAALERLINIKSAAFVFSLNSNSFQKSVDLIKRIYDVGNIALLSTSCERDSFNKARISKNLEFLKERLPSSVYLDIMLRSHSFLR